MQKIRLKNLFRAGLIILAGGSLVLSCRPTPSVPNAIFILIDAARSDRYGAYGYGKETSPQLDSLAEEGAVCLRNFSNGTYTLESVPTYFYSRYYIKTLFPADARLPLQEPENLFRDLDPEAISMAGLFKQAGYRTVLFSAHPWLVRGYELVGDFDEFHQVRDRNYPHAVAGDVLAEVESWLADDPPQPFFIYVHLMDPHTPRIRRGETMIFADPDYDHREKFDRHGNPVGEYLGPDGAWRIPDDLGQDDLAYLNALYDGEILYTDRSLGEFITFMRERGLYDRTLMVIGADHGQHLGEHGYSQHGGKPYEAVIRTPLVMRLPARIPAGTRIDTITENVDILPTMAGVLGISVPNGKSFDGRDIFRPPDFPEPAGRALSPGFIRTLDHKLIIEKETGEEFLYDLKNDPGEENNLAAVKPELAAELRAEWEGALKRSKRRYEAATITGPPRLPFAIPARSFTLDSLSPRVELKKFIHPWQEPELLARLRGEPIWIQNIPPGRDFVLGFNQAGLEPLTLSFPVPNGDYRVNLHSPGAPDIQGYPGSVFEIRLGGGDSLVSLPVNTAQPGAGDGVDLGVVRIEDETFTAVILPAPESSWVMLDYFSFEPLLSGDGPDEVDQEDAAERRERLKALGYMQ